MGRSVLGIIVTGILAWCWTPAARAQPDGSPALARLLDCQALPDAGARLACYDREAKATRTALDRREVVILDAAKVEGSRRSMFGLSDPDQKILKRNVKTAAPFVAVDSTVKAASPAGYGHYAITIEGGAVWRNVDLLDAPPVVGAKIHIEKTAFGSYLLKMPNFQSVHAARVR